MIQPFKNSESSRHSGLRLDRTRTRSAHPFPPFSPFPKITPREREIRLGLRDFSHSRAAVLTVAARLSRSATIPSSASSRPRSVAAKRRGEVRRDRPCKARARANGALGIPPRGRVGGRRLVRGGAVRALVDGRPVRAAIRPNRTRRCAANGAE